MKAEFKATVLSLLVASQKVRGFAPKSTPIQSRVQKLPTSNFLQRFMVMDSGNDSMGKSPFPLKDKKSTNPTPFFVSLFQNKASTEEKDNTSDAPAKVGAVALAMALALMPFQADAAMSGGRMGGSFSAPRPSMSRPSISRPSSSSYTRGYSSGYASGYYSRPSVAITPGLGYGYNPFFGSGGVYYGGVSAVSVARRPTFFDTILVVGLLFGIANVLDGARSGISSSMEGMSWADSTRNMSTLGPGTSVAQLSVAIEVPNRDDPNSILSVLNRLSQTASTDSRVGVQSLTNQVAIELLRRKSSIISASSDYRHFNDRAKAGRDYEVRSIKERSKFERESVSKYGGVDYSSPQGLLQGMGNNALPKATVAVITLVMAIDGDATKVPRINSISNVEEALRLIASNSKVDDCLQSVEILWTPEERTETLSIRDVIADYPELRSV